VVIPDAIVGKPSDIAAAAAVATDPAAVADGGRASGGGSVRMPSSTNDKLLIITRPSTLHDAMIVKQ
jgi:hypothetical protein